MTAQGSQTQISLRKILCATDFSPYSETALRYGLGFSRRFDAILYTVSVVSAELVYDVRPPDPLYLRHSAEAKMGKLADSDLFQGIKHIELIEEGFGSVSNVLLELADRLHIDLIVLGTHGRSGIKHLALGSVAEEIVNRAPCAVLTVGPHVLPKSGLVLKLRRLLCATDLGPASTRVLSYAIWLGEGDHAHLTLLHVLNMATDESSQQRTAETETAMKKLMQLLSAETISCLEVQTSVEIGAPAKQILKVAGDQGVDLIVIGPHHTLHPRVSAHLPWGMLHQVLCRAQCPVLRVQD